MRLLTAAALLALLALPGCAKMFSQRTTASYVTTHPDGRRTQVNWDSDQEHIGLNAAFDEKGARIKVEKAGTMESVVAAVQAQQQQILGLLQKLAPLADLAAQAGS